MCRFAVEKGIVSLEERDAGVVRPRSRKVVVIAGLTGVGKTAISLLLADLLGGEIISADALQVYIGMDIGTAKVSLSERLRVPHHLIDIRKVWESFNVVDFYAIARTCIDSVLARGRVPIIVGGSSFYVHTLIYGPPEGPPADANLRQRLLLELEAIGNEAMYQKLQKLDAEYAKTVTVNDRHKIVRALEIIELTGKKVCLHKWKRDAPLQDYQYHNWFIYRSRPIVNSILDARCLRMLKQGLLDEVELLAQQGIRDNYSAASAIGYRQSLVYLESSQSPQDYEHLVQSFQRASRRYAKRQLTWFRQEPLFQWINLDIYDLEIVAEMIAKELDSFI